MAMQYRRPGVPPADDPTILQAMTVWDNLTPQEQRNVFQGIVQAVTGFSRTKDIDHLVNLSQSVNEMVLLERQPGFTEARRNPPKEPEEPSESVGISEVIRRLRE